MSMPSRLLTSWLVLTLGGLPGQELRHDAFNRYVGSTTYTFKAEGHGQIVMENVRGDISLSGEPMEEVKIVESITIRSNSEKEAAGRFEKARASVKQVSAENKPLAVWVTGARLGPRPASPSYSITVPAVFSVQIKSRGGDIHLENVQGQIDVSTGGGDLELSGLSGKISATTSGGDIEGVDLGGRVILNTSGGDIDVEEVKGELGARTSGGDIEVSYVRGGVSLITSGGDIDLFDVEGREISGRTSGGDIGAQKVTGSVDLTSAGGNITAEEVQGDIQASTSGGDIDMKGIEGTARVWTSAGSITGEEIAGALDARTSVGDIVVSKVWNKGLEDHDVDLKTSTGDIHLTLPGNFPARFSVKAISPEMRPGEAIVSDFPLVITASEAIARAKGTVGEGKFYVRLESAVGGITISREE